MTEIDLNNVDQYPLFKNCDETVSKEEQQQCFITELMLHFESIIEELNFESKMNLEDTLWVDLKVDEQGYVTINNFLQNENLESAIPELSGELMNRLNDSTKIEPALKRGVPVSIRVRLPILVETKG